MKKIFTLLVLAMLFIAGKAFALTTYQAIEIGDEWVEIAPNVDGNTYMNIQNTCTQVLEYTTDNTVANPPRMMPLDSRIGIDKTLYIRKHRSSYGNCLLTIERY